MSFHCVKSMLYYSKGLLIFMFLLNRQYSFWKIFGGIVIQSSGQICIFNVRETCEFNIFKIYLFYTFLLARDLESTVSLEGFFEFNQSNINKFRVIFIFLGYVNSLYLYLAGLLLLRSSAYKSKLAQLLIFILENGSTGNQKLALFIF